MRKESVEIFVNNLLSLDVQKIIQEESKDAPLHLRSDLSTIKLHCMCLPLSHIEMLIEAVKDKKHLLTKN